MHRLSLPSPSAFVLSRAVFFVASVAACSSPSVGEHDAAVLVDAATDERDAARVIDASSAGDGAITDAALAPSPDAGAPATDAAMPDAGAAPSVSTSWARRFEDTMQVWVGLQPDGDAVLGVGVDTRWDVVLDDGTVIDASYNPAIVWLSGADGATQRVLRVSAGSAGTSLANDMRVASNGAVVMTGSFAGASHTFFPGSPLARVETVRPPRSVGDMGYATLDPWVVAYDPAGEPAWFARGRTPSHLPTLHWDNTPSSLALTSASDLWLVGRFAGSGFVMGADSPAATTLSTPAGSAGSYIARLVDGELASVSTHGALLVPRSERSADGGLYTSFQMREPTPLFAGTAGAITLTERDPSEVTSVLVHLDPTGALRWVRRIAGALPDAMVARADGGVVTSWLPAAGAVEVLETSTSRAVDPSTTQAVLVSFSAAGEVEWTRDLGPLDVLYTVADGSGLWATARSFVTADPALLPGPLPSWTLLTTSTYYTWLLHLTPEGELDRAHVIGVDLGSTRLSVRGDEALIAAPILCASPRGAIAVEGELVWLACEGSARYTGIVAKLAL